MFLQTYFPDGEGSWIKLWRDMIWKTLRGIPATRGVYEERANLKQSSLGMEFWDKLLKAYDYQEKGKYFIEGFSSSIFLGAEDKNPENIPFIGTIVNNLLLHFWPISSFTYVPRILKRTKKDWEIHPAEDGYVIVVPEPANLKSFIEDVTLFLRSLDPKKIGYRPKDALIDLYQEGGLEYLYHFVKTKLENEELSFSLNALELYYLRKQGNRVRQLACERILPQKRIIKDYENLRKRAANPLFKSIYIRNLLDDTPWYNNADSILNQYPMLFFIFCHDNSLREIKFFGIDVKRKLLDIEQNIKIISEGGKMGEKELDDLLVLRIYRIIQTFVNYKTEKKSGIRYGDFKDNKNSQGHVIYPESYREAREKVCSDAFLAIRGRREQDFIEYFSGTICSVPQYMSETDYLKVATSLMKDWEKIKTFSMLSLSAHSYISERND